MCSGHDSSQQSRLSVTCRRTDRLVVHMAALQRTASTDLPRKTMCPWRLQSVVCLEWTPAQVTAGYTCAEVRNGDVAPETAGDEDDVGRRPAGEAEQDRGAPLHRFFGSDDLVLWLRMQPCRNGLARLPNRQAAAHGSRAALVSTAVHVQTAAGDLQPRPASAACGQGSQEEASPLVQEWMITNWDVEQYDVSP